MANLITYRCDACPRLVTCREDNSLTCANCGPLYLMVPLDRSYELIDTLEDETLATYPTLKQARWHARRDGLSHYAIWRDDGIRVEWCEPGPDEDVPYDTPSLNDHPWTIFQRGEKA